MSGSSSGRLASFSELLLLSAPSEAAVELVADDAALLAARVVMCSGSDGCNLDQEDFDGEVLLLAPRLDLRNFASGDMADRIISLISKVNRARNIDSGYTYTVVQYCH